MLVIRRKIRERVFFRNKTTGETIGNVVLLDSTLSAARLGFDLAENVEIIREEIYDDNLTEPNQLV